MQIVVCAKQVVDPLLSTADLTLDAEGRTVVARGQEQWVVNGFDEQALEAALRIRDKMPNTVITLLSAAERIVPAVTRRLMAVNVDEAIVIEDPRCASHDPRVVARILVAAIHRLDSVDVVFCGRQASDWDNAQVPLRMAETLGWPCLTLARDVQIQENRLQVRQVLPYGWQDMASPLPAVVTVTSELGELRYPTMKGRMNAMKRHPKQWAFDDLGIAVEPATELLSVELMHHQVGEPCRFIDGDRAADRGRALAVTLAAAGLIHVGETGGNV